MLAVVARVAARPLRARACFAFSVYQAVLAVVARVAARRGVAVEEAYAVGPTAPDLRAELASALAAHTADGDTAADLRERSPPRVI